MSEIPEDIMKTAFGHFQKTFFSQDIDTTTCIARAILAERERCAKIIEDMASEWKLRGGLPSAEGEWPAHMARAIRSKT